MTFFFRQIKLSCLVRKPTMWFPNTSYTNQAVQPQKQIRSRVEIADLCRPTIRVAKTKALISFAVTAKLVCAFVCICKLLVFS